MGTPRKVHIKAINPGWYHGFDIEDAIVASLNSRNFHFSSDRVVLKMLVGIDGTPLGKCSNSQLWPILGLLCMDEAEPCDLGFYHGHAMPDDAIQYLKHFSEEILQLTNNAFLYIGCRIKIKLQEFCCDAPACSFIKNVKPYGSYHGCMKCEAEGMYVRNISGQGGRVTYPETDAILRTDKSFRHQEQLHYHNRWSILETLPINMVDAFSIDPMHLVQMEVMQKLLFICY